MGQYEEEGQKNEIRRQEVKELQKYMKLRNAKKAASEIRTQILDDQKSDYIKVKKEMKINLEQWYKELEED